MKDLFNQLKNKPLIKALQTHYQSAEVDMSSIAVAYYLLLTLFPLLVLVANIFPYLNIDTADLLRFLQEHLPADFYSIVSDLVETIFNRPATGLVWLSLVTGLWTMSKGLVFLQKAFNKAYAMEEQRDFLIGRLMGGLSGMVLIAFLALAVLLSTFGRTFLTLLQNRLGLGDDLYRLLLNLLQPAVALVFVLALGVLYLLLPNVRIRKWHYVLPGSLFTSLSLVVVASFFGTYVNRTIQNMENLRVLGSVAIFALMLWFIFFAKVLIIGAVLNASYQSLHEVAFDPRRGKVTELLAGSEEE